MFSEYRRRSSIEEDGFVKCVTCGKRMRWQDSQCGHYISRNRLAVRWNPKNTAPQCVGCNVFKAGNMPEYTLYLQQKYGKGIIEKLVKESKQIIKLRSADLEDMIKVYQNKLDKLKGE